VTVPNTISRLRLTARLNKEQPATTSIDGDEAARLVQYIDDLHELVCLSFFEAYGLGPRGTACLLDSWNRSGTRAVLNGEASVDELRTDQADRR
jgi:hypothetical protein